MLDFETLAIFLPTSIALILAPGPDTLYVLSQALSTGREVGLRSAFGISTGVLIHTTAAVFGLSVILRQSAMAFHVIKWIGAIYLVILGLQTLRSSQQFSIQDTDSEPVNDTAEQSIESTTDRDFVRGVLVNVLNPKVALFFLMFLPQFIPPSAPQSSLQMLLLGGIYSLLTLVYLSFVALLSGHVRSALASRARIDDYLRYGAGTTYVGLGVGLAVEKDLLT